MKRKQFPLSFVYENDAVGFSCIQPSIACWRSGATSERRKENNWFNFLCWYNWKNAILPRKRWSARLAQALNILWAVHMIALDKNMHAQRGPIAKEKRFSTTEWEKQQENKLRSDCWKAYRPLCATTGQRGAMAGMEVQLSFSLSETYKLGTSESVFY